MKAPAKSRPRSEAEAAGSSADGCERRSVGIVLRVIDLFADAPELGASEVARRIGVAKSTAHATLAALASGGLIERTPGGRYRLGLKMLELGQITAARLELRTLALPILTELRNATGEMAQLGLPAQLEVYYVERVEAGCRFTNDSYRRVPMHSSSTGKVLLAFNPPMAAACVKRGLKPMTPYTLVHVPQFLAALTDIRSKGFTFSVEEYELGLASVAAPVIPPQSANAVAAISVVGSADRLVGRQDHVVPLVVNAAKRLGILVAKSGQAAATES